MRDSFQVWDLEVAHRSKNAQLEDTLAALDHTRTTAGYVTWARKTGIVSEASHLQASLFLTHSQELKEMAEAAAVEGVQARKD